MPGNIFIFYSLQVPRNFHSSSATADNPVPLIDDVLVYNAVPKCGSTTMTRLFTILSKKNGYNFEKMLSWRGFSDPKWSIKTQVRHHIEHRKFIHFLVDKITFSAKADQECAVPSAPVCSAETPAFSEFHSRGRIQPRKADLHQLP